MVAKIIDGKQYAARITDKLADTVKTIKAEHDFTPGLAVVLVGDDPASKIYVKSKTKKTKAIGMKSVQHRLDSDASEQQLLDLVDQLNKDDTIDGILVQLPLPGHIDSAKVINAIDPDKDVDGFSISNVGKLVTGQAGLFPCTPVGCVMLANSVVGDDLSGLDAIVIGRSNIVGKPLFHLLLKQSCTVTIAHSRTKGLADLCRKADLVFAAVGRPEMVKADWIKPGSVVIDVGINRLSDNGGGRIVGDVAYDEVKNVAGAITPVPGGVGPMTIACLLRNAIKASLLRRNLDLANF